MAQCYTPQTSTKEKTANLKMTYCRIYERIVLNDIQKGVPPLRASIGARVNADVRNSKYMKLDKTYGKLLKCFSK